MFARKLFILLVLVGLALSTSACYLNEQVHNDQIGVQLDGGRIKAIVSPGIYTDMGFFADLRQIPAGTLTFDVTDPEVLTKDNQPVGETVTIQARRNPDSQSVINLMTNWSALVNDDVLKTTVTSTALEGMKVGTRAFTLPELLDDRNGLANSVQKQLQDDADKYGVTIVNVIISNIAPDPAYTDLLKQKANYIAQTDAEKQRQELIKQQGSNNQLQQQQNVLVAQQQLLAEQAISKVQLEIANRQGNIIKAQNAVYLDNREAFELAKLDKLSTILGSKATVYFLPQGTDITLLWNPSAGITNTQVIPLK